MNTEEHNRRETHNPKKRSPRQKRNPIETAISSWYEKHTSRLAHRHALGDLIAQAPKRWTAYGSLALLPAGSFTTTTWREVLDSTTRQDSHFSSENHQTANEADDGPTILWKTTLAEISRTGGTKLTHLAVNEGIPLHSDGGGAAGEAENILRSPSGLRMLYGDYGPEVGDAPTEDDFARAFWVSTKQNGITQTWAPRWTMFSRGNVKEKARLLRFHDPLDENQNGNGDESEKLAHRLIPASRRRGAAAVDLYAGIGYFTFSYAASGFRKVFCWELNPWSVEGLRRGAKANGWGVSVVTLPPSLHPHQAEQGEEDMVLKDVLAGDETIIVFLENNARAVDRLRRLDQLSRGQGMEQEDGESGFRMRSIMHVNMGLLPTSQLSWASASEITRGSQLAWFHIHENVGAADIDAKKAEIRQWFAERTPHGDTDGVRTNISVEHVELVKTFAPGVWHCVFDLRVKREVSGGVR